MDFGRLALGRHATLLTLPAEGVSGDESSWTILWRTVYTIGPIDLPTGRMQTTEKCCNMTKIKILAQDILFFIN